MFSKSTKRLSVFFSAAILSVFLTGINIRKAEAVPNYLVTMIAVQATGYALPRVYKRLTPQERKQVDAIQNEAFRQITNVLTTAQRSQIMQSLKTPQGRRKLLQAMKLTPKQKARIQSIVKKSRQRMNAIIGN